MPFGPAQENHEELYFKTALEMKDALFDGKTEKACLSATGERRRRNSMKDLYPMHGIITTVLTPFCPEDKQIDWESFRRQIQTALKAGVAGYLVPCNASEIKELSWEERKQLVAEAVAIVGGKALVIPSVNADSVEECEKQCREYLDLHVDGININIPYTTNEAYLEVVRRLDKLNPPFICLQDYSLEGDGLPDELLVRCFEEVPSVRCAKIEVQNSGPKYTRILEKTGGRMNVSGAWGSAQSIEAYDRGIHAMMPSGLYELFVNVYRLYHEKDREAAKKLFYAMLPIISFTRQNPSLNLYFHKLYLNRIGVFASTTMRQEYLFDEYHMCYADTLINYAINLRDNIPEYWK